MRVFSISILLLLACFFLAAQSPPSLRDLDQAKIAQAEKEHGAESRELADALSDYSRTALFARVTTPEVMQVAQRAVDVTEIAYGKASAAYVYALAWQAGLENLRGNFAASQAIATPALELARHLSPAEPEALQQAANALGNACSQMGDEVDALAAYGAAVESIHTEPAPNLKGLSTILMNRAQVYSHLHRDEESLADMREADPLIEKVYGSDSLQFTLTHNYFLGTSAMMDGRPVEAVAYLEKAMAAGERYFGPDRTQMAYIRGILGDALARAGQFDRAYAVIQQAIDVERRLLSPEHPEIAKTLAIQARAFASGGDLSRALAVALESERISRHHFLVTAAALPERQALGYASSRVHGLDIALSVVSNEREMPYAGAFEELIRSRALVADGMAWRNQEVAISQDAGVKLLAQTLRDRRTKLAQLAISPTPSSPDYAQRLMSARRDVEEAETQLADHSAVFEREQQEHSVSLQEVSDALPSGAMLVSYVRYRQYAVRRVDPKGGSSENYGAFVLKKGAPLRYVALGAAQSIDALVASLRTLIETESSAAGISPRMSEQQYRQAGENCAAPSGTLWRVRPI